MKLGLDFSDSTAHFVTGFCVGMGVLGLVIKWDQLAYVALLLALLIGLSSGKK